MSRFRSTILILMCLLITTSLWSRDRSTQVDPQTQRTETDLQIRYDRLAGKIRLDWQSPAETETWRVLVRSEVQAIPDTLPVTWQPWLDLPLDPSQPRAFYQVIPWTGAPFPADSVMLADFENEPVFGSWADEDHDPDGWNRDFLVVDEGAYSLHLSGNTYKLQTITPRNCTLATVWRVSARSGLVSDRQMLGISNGEDVLWYVFWGERGGYDDTPGQSGQEEVSTYQGYFPTDEWVTFELPLGMDWFGKYGYLPEVSNLIWANDRDDEAGEVWFDALEDITGLSQQGPHARFVTEVLAETADSMRVSFTSLSVPEGLDHSWYLGEAGMSTWTHTVRWLPQAHNQRVMLQVTDEQGRWSLSSTEIAADTLTPPRTWSMSMVGDVMMARRYEEAGGIIPEEGVDAIYDSVRTLFQEPDLMMINLECPLTEATEPHPTKSIIFRSNPDNVAGLVNAGVDFATLANNHVFDYMAPGMTETEQVLDQAGILHTGSGLNSLRAAAPAFLQAQGMLVGVLAFCDRTGNYNNYQPFLDAGRSRPGFALWSRGENERCIPPLRPHVDWLVVQVHSGNEYSTAPSEYRLAEIDDLPFDPENRGLFARDLLPDQSERSLRQEAITLGADMVITHHPHILQGLELFDGHLIAHSMGNFVMDLDYVETMWTLLLNVEMEENTLSRVNLRPHIIDRYKPRPTRGELGAALLDHLAVLSRAFDTWVLRAPGEDVGTLALDTTQVILHQDEFQTTLQLHDQGDHMLSEPLKLNGDVSLSEFSVDDLLDGLEYRFGRDILWWGNMEDEGARLWDINSAGEWYDHTEVWRGERSLQLHAANGDYVRNYFLLRVPLDTRYDYSFMGMVRASGSSEVSLQMRYYTHRTTGSVMATQIADGPQEGSFDWTPVWAELDPPPEANFYSVRHQVTAPNSGTADAWFDDVDLIQWDDWASEVPEFPFPNDYDFVQIRVPVAPETVAVSYQRQWGENPAAP